MRSIFTAFISFFLLQSSFAGDAVWKGGASGVWDNGALNWTVDGTPNQAFTDGDTVIFDDSASTFSITAVGTVAPASVLVSNTTTYTFAEVRIGGTGQLVKAGSGTLSIPRDTPATNTYTGGTVVNGGILSFAFDHPLGDPAASLTVNGAALYLGDRSWTSTRPVIVTGSNTFRTAGNCNWNCAGPVSGPGAILAMSIPNGGQSLTLSSLTNTFTGELGIDGSRQRFYVNLSSLADSPGAGNIYWLPSTHTSDNNTTWRSDATNDLLLNNRRLEFRGDGDLTNMKLRNDNSSHRIIVSTDFLVSGNGNKIFYFDAVRAGVTNVISGDITEGTSGATLSVTKAGSGDLLLSGVNTYSGITTVSGSGTVITEGEFALPEEGTLNLSTGSMLEIRDRHEVTAILQFDGVAQTNGTWGSSLSIAQNTDDSRFAGEGILYVGLPRPAKGTVIILY